MSDKPVRLGDRLEYENLRGVIDIAMVTKVNDDGSFHVTWADGFDDHNETWTREEFVYMEEN